MWQVGTCMRIIFSFCTQGFACSGGRSIFALNVISGGHSSWLLMNKPRRGGNCSTASHHRRRTGGGSTAMCIQYGGGCGTTLYRRTCSVMLLPSALRMLPTRLRAVTEPFARINARPSTADRAPPRSVPCLSACYASVQRLRYCTFRTSSFLTTVALTTTWTFSAR